MVLVNFPQNFIGSINANTNFPPQSQLGGIPFDWFNANFKRRVPITINASQIPSTQTDFPFLFNSLFSDIEGGNAKADGGDIRFALQDKTELKSEIQFIDVSTNNGELIAWTKVPSIQVGTSFFMYYDNPAATLPTDPENVWDSGYKGVWHSSQDPTGGVDAMRDSTVNANHGTTAGSPTSVDGKIGKCLSYADLSGDVVRILENGKLDLTTQLTLSGWYETPSTTGDMFGHWLQAPVAGYRMSLFGGSYFFGVDRITTVPELLQITSPRPDSNFHSVVGTWDSSGDMRLYVDGVLETGPTAHVGTMDNTNAIGRIGNELGTGSILILCDELRISVYSLGKFTHRTNLPIS